MQGMWDATPTMQRESFKSKDANPEELPTPKTWLDAVTADNAICGKSESPRHGETCTVVIQYRHIPWMCPYPMRTKNTTDTAYALRRVVGPQSMPEHIYTDDSGEFAAATK